MLDLLPARLPASPSSFALIGPLDWTELAVIAMAALMVFGSRLPEVALRAVAHIMRARRAVARMWRETGLEDELRRVRRDIELNIPREADFDVSLKPRPASSDSASGDSASTNEARAAAERAREAAERSTSEAEDRRRNGEAYAPPEALGLEQAADSIDPDADRMGEVRLEPAEGIIAAGDTWGDGVGLDAGFDSGSEHEIEPGEDPALAAPARPHVEDDGEPRFGQGVDMAPPSEPA